MAVVASNQYVYFGPNLNQITLSGSLIADRGAWSSLAFYSPMDAVQIGVDLFLALQANSNTPPTSIVDANWSALVVVNLDGSNVSDLYARSLAQTGTNIAWAAYYLAQIGTNTGTAAYELAAAAYALAGSNSISVALDAYHLAQIGTNTGTAALQLAATGTNVAWAAYSLAQTGTNIATSAFDLAQIGTNTGTAAYNLASTGSNLAWSAYVIAQAGTVIPPLSALPDVSVPAPIVHQVLAFNGSVWYAADNAAQVAPGAFTFFLEDIASGTGSYANLLTVPSGVAENADAVSVGGTQPFVLVEGYISDFLNRSILSNGVWEFNSYASTGNTTQSVVLVTDMYLRNLAGVETYLFSGSTNPVTSTTPQLYTAIVTQGSYLVNLTDKLVSKYYFLRAASPATTATLYHSGTSHDSHIHTPLGIPHNDLQGLQGGQIDQFYHTTLNQNEALAGNSGIPSASNPFTTVAGIALTHNLAQSAYAIAQIGTNTGTAAYILAGTHTHLASHIFPATFQSGSYVFPGTVTLQQTGSLDALRIINASAGEGVVSVDVDGALALSTRNAAAYKGIKLKQFIGDTPQIPFQIDALGNTGLGVTPSAGNRLDVGGNLKISSGNLLFSTNFGILGTTVTNLNDTIANTQKLFGVFSSDFQPTNRPTGTNYLSGLEIRHNLVTDYRCQIASDNAVSPNLYVRAKSLGTWTAWWKAVLMTDLGNASVTNTMSANTFTAAVATGTAPLTITSTTVVANLNADLLDGAHASAFSLVGHWHPASEVHAGTFDAGNFVFPNVLQVNDRIWINYAGGDALAGRLYVGGDTYLMATANGMSTAYTQIFMSPTSHWTKISNQNLIAGFGYIYFEQIDPFANSRIPLTISGAATAEVLITGNERVTGSLSLRTTNVAEVLEIGTAATTGKFYVHLITTTNDLYYGQSDGALFGYGAGLIGALAQNGTVPLLLGTLGVQPLLLGTQNLVRAQIDSAGNFGVGAAPSRHVHFQQSVTYTAPPLGTASGELFISGPDGLYGLYVGVSGTGNTWFQAQRNDSAVAYSLLLNPSGGNVVIGRQSTGDDRLDIAEGNIRFTTSVGGTGDLGVIRATNYMLMNPNLISAKITFERAATDWGDEADIVFATNNGNSTLANRMRIKQNGNIALGLVDPQYLCHAYGAASQLISLQTTGAAGPLITWLYGGTQKAFMGPDGGALTVGASQSDLTVRNDGGGGFIRFNYGGTTWMAIDYLGGVGIGTTATGWAGSGKNVRIGYGGTGGATASTLQVVSGANDSSLTLYSGLNAADGPALVYQANTTFRIGNVTAYDASAGFTLRFAIDTDGNIMAGGYGSGGTPKFYLSKGATTRCIMTLSDGDTSSIMLAGGAIGGVFAYGVLASDRGLNFRTGASYVAPDTGGVTVMTMDNTGKVGIATTTPWAYLTTAPSWSGAPSLTHQAACSVSLGTGGGVDLAMGQLNTSPFSWWMQTRHNTADDAAYSIALNPLGGNVGVGMLNPLYRLQVNAAVGSSAILLLANNDFVSASTGSGMAFATGAASGNTYSQIWAFGAGGGAVANLILNGSGGNVAVGRTDPSFTLDVYKAGSGPPGRLVTTYGTTVWRYDTLNVSSGLERNWAAGANIYGYGDFGFKQSDAQGGDPMAAGTIRLYISPAGNVAVGAVNPIKKVEIAGGVAGDTFEALVLNNPTAYGVGLGTASSRLTFNRVNTDAGRMAYIEGGNSDEASSIYGYLAFGTRENDVLAEQMRIDTNGNVGINSTNPLARLHVVTAAVSGSLAEGLRLQNPDVTYAINTGVGVSFYVDRQLAGIYGAYDQNLNAAYGYLSFYTRHWNGASEVVTEKMRISPLGNVGIGISAPALMLHVEGARYSDDYPAVTYLVDTTAYNGANPGGGLAFGGRYHVDGHTTLLAGIQGVKENTTSNNWAGALRFFTRVNGEYAFTERMRITSIGYTGIGTTAPISLLSNHNTNLSIGIATRGLLWHVTENDWAAVISAQPASGSCYALRLHTLGATANDSPLYITAATNLVFQVTGIGATLLKSAAGNAYHALQTASGNQWAIIRYNSPARFAIDEVGASSWLTITDTTGYVGLAKSTPQSYLDYRAPGNGTELNNRLLGYCADSNPNIGWYVVLSPITAAVSGAAFSGLKGRITLGRFGGTPRFQEYQVTVANSWASGNLIYTITPLNYGLSSAWATPKMLKATYSGQDYYVMDLSAIQAAWAGSADIWFSGTYIDGQTATAAPIGVVNYADLSNISTLSTYLTQGDNVTTSALGNVGIITVGQDTYLGQAGWSNYGLAVGDAAGSGAIVIMSASDSSTSSLRFGDGGIGAYDQGFVAYSHATDTMALGTARSTRMSISAGLIVIGSGSPTALFNVLGGRSLLNDAARSGANPRNYGYSLYGDHLFGAELGYNGSVWTHRIFTRDADGAIEFGKYPTGSTTNVNQFSPWVTFAQDGGVTVHGLTHASLSRLVRVTTAGLMTADIPILITSPATGAYLKFDGTNWVDAVFSENASTIQSGTFPGSYVISGSLQVNTGYKSSDGTTGQSGFATAPGLWTINFKDGLMVSITPP